METNEDVDYLHDLLEKWFCLLCTGKVDRRLLVRTEDAMRKQMGAPVTFTFAETAGF
jgi:hypothetical protein